MPSAGIDRFVTTRLAGESTAVQLKTGSSRSSARWRQSFGFPMFKNGFSEALLRCPMAGMKATPEGSGSQGSEAPWAHRRPGDPLSGCVPAEPDSVFPDDSTIPISAGMFQPPLDTGVMPQKIRESTNPPSTCARTRRARIFVSFKDSDR